ncbi:MAG: 30S ribosomal protein S21 [Bacteroidetes bacterium]|nr:30S ribosomal protein S21 [Bacteroidota bacterium]
MANIEVHHDEDLEKALKRFKRKELKQYENLKKEFVLIFTRFFLQLI